MGCPLLGNGCGSGIMDIPEKLEIKRIKEAAKK